MNRSADKVAEIPPAVVTVNDCRALTVTRSPVLMLHDVLFAVTAMDVAAADTSPAQVGSVSSPVGVDADQIVAAAQAIIDSLPDGYRFDAVVGPETGGAKLACAIGGIMGQPWTGALKNPDGFWFRSWSDKWREVLIVEDVLTTGGSLDKVVTEVNRLVRGDAERGGRVQMKRALLNRGGVQMAGLETIASLDAVSYPAEECLLCKAGVPISTDAGHAKPKV